MKKMQENKICSFFGVKALTYTCDEFREKAFIAIVGVFEGGCHTFYFTGDGEFDAMCHSIVSTIREGYASVLSVNRYLCVKDEATLKEKMRTLDPEQYEGVLYILTPPGGEQKSAYARDCAMIDASDVTVFCAEEKGNGHACRAYKYAQGKEKQIVDLWESYAPVLVPRSVAKSLPHMREGIFSVD